MNKNIVLLAGAVTLSGCVATGGQLSLDSITNSLDEQLRPETTMEKFDTKLTQGNMAEATKIAIDEAEYDAEKNTLDDQLWGMQTASIYRLQRDYESSNKYFDSIEDVMYQEDTEGVIETAGETIVSTLTNDSYLDYEQSVYDSIMVNTYKALNFTATGDFNNARIEWNRSDDRQRRAADFFAEKINEKKETQQKEAQEERNKQAEKNASAISVLDQQENIDKTYSQAETILAQQGIDMSQWGAYDGYVNPFATYMHGLYFMLKGQDTADLNKAIDSLKRVSEMTNTSVAAESLALAQQIMSGATSRNELNKVWVIFENGQMAQKEEFRVDLPLFLVSDNVNYVGFALPKIKERPDHFGRIMVDGVNSEVIADMDKIIKAEFKEEFPLILTREITRTVFKTIAQKQINDRNQYLGAAASIFSAATTGADTRTWSILPKNFQALMLDNTGKTQLTIDSQGFAEPIQVDLVPGKHNIVYVKATSANLPTSVEIIAL